MGARVGEVEKKLDISKSEYTKEETERGKEGCVQERWKVRGWGSRR